MKSAGSLRILLLLVLPLFISGLAVAGDPIDIDLELNPGETAEVVCTVNIPCDANPPKADIYILADTTGSMQNILDAVADTADELVDTLIGTPGVDVRIGVGNYRDFPLQFSTFAFENNQSLTQDTVAIKSALSSWIAETGGDKSEGEFYAMTKILRDPSIGFRKGADVKRIIVWFGDAPAHDAICEDIHNDIEIPFDITEETLLADLQNSGEGGTTVIAISTRIGIPGALDADPTLFADDYVGICEIGGTPGQATRLTDATGGIHIVELPEPKEITPAILEAVDTVLRRVDVTAEVVGDILPSLVSIEPAMYEDVVVPTCPEQDLELEFTFTFEGQHCIENEHVFYGAIRTLIDEELHEGKSVRITQPLCEEAACFLVIGAKTASIALSEDPADMLLLKPKRPKSEWVLPVTMETIPSFEVPSDQKLVGKKMYMQVYMNNPVDFPGNPVQVSNGLEITIGSNSIPVPYGPENAINLWGLSPTPLGGTLELMFSIDGL